MSTAPVSCIADSTTSDTKENDTKTKVNRSRLAYLPFESAFRIRANQLVTQPGLAILKMAIPALRTLGIVIENGSR